jgi:Uma2 family endonuclease
MRLMSGAKVTAQSGCSPADFLTWERAQPERHEYFRGEVFAMAGGSPRHNALCSSVNAALHGALRPCGCRVFSSDQRVGLDRGERYVYPDVTVVCGAVVLESGTRDILAEPTIVVEVISASTEQYDRGLKWEGYQRIASLTDYLLVSQGEARIEHFRRSESGSWIYRSLGPGESVALANGVSLSVDAVFAGNLEIPGD